METMSFDIDYQLQYKHYPPIGMGPGSVMRGKSVHCFPDNYLGHKCNSVLSDIQYRIKARQYVKSIANCLRLGFRMIDYSSVYGDGFLLHRAIEKSGVSRDEIMITTRVSNPAQREGRVRDEFMHFLERIKLDYIDILQFHWPVTDCYLNTWKEMEKLYEEGYVRHLGVANCHQHHLEDIFRICKYKPEIGQFEIHPLFTQKPLIQYYKDKGIVVEAYTPVARFDDRLIRLPLLKKIGNKYNKNVVQVILRWHVQNGVIPVVRTLSLQHQKENLDIFDFELSDDEMKSIDSININSRLRYNPDNCDFSIL